MHPLLNVGIDAARKASKVILQAVDRADDLKVTEKHLNDFVTEVDLKSEAVIIETIRAAYPNHGILAEESGEDTQDDADVRWVIDPLDGTTNFIHGIPQYCISLAAQHKGLTQVAVIFDPVKNELFSAVKGEGAQLNNRRMRVSGCKKLSAALIGTGFPFKSPQQLSHYLDMFKSIFTNVAGVRRAGSAALDLAYVAAGRLDGFWEISLKPWDMAAGVLLIKEAGGIVSDFEHNDRYMENGHIVAGNPKVFKCLLEKIQQAIHA